MSFLNARERAELDRYITGNYGEDSVPDDYDGRMTEDEMNEARLDQLDEADTRKALDVMAREGMVSPAEDDPPQSAGLCLTHGDYNGRLLRCPKCPPETTCIDCGQPTTPGKGSARCPGCWEDRCDRAGI